MRHITFIYSTQISKAYVLRQKSYGPDTIRWEEREREERDREEEKLRQIQYIALLRREDIIRTRLQSSNHHLLLFSKWEELHWTRWNVLQRTIQITKRPFEDSWQKNWYNCNPNNISRYISLTLVSSLTPECIDDPNASAREYQNCIVVVLLLETETMTLFDIDFIMTWQ